MKELTRRQFAGHALAAAAFAASVLPVPVAAASKLMAKRKIPSTGVELGILGFGNSAVFNPRTDPEEAKQTSRALFDLLVEMGGNFVDSYYDAYLNLAEWLDSDVISQVHFSAGFAAFGRPLTEDDIPGLPGLMKSAQLAFLTVHQHLDMSMSERYWPLARRAKEAGYARHIGVSWNASSDTPDADEVFIDFMRAEKPDFVEINYSIMTPHPESRLLPTAMDLGIGVIAMKPFQDGAYFSQVSGRELPGWASEFCDSWAQFCLKYIVSHPAVTVAISETGNLEHAQDNLGAGIGPLPDEATRNRMKEVYASLPSPRSRTRP
jgi:aryl-alcohol dehydrogenase-like predicted oxidoreductase